MASKFLRRRTVQLISAVAVFIFILVFLTPLHSAIRESLRYPAVRLVDDHPIKVSLKKIWEKKFSERIVSRPIVCDGSVYVPFLSGRLECFDLDSGEQRWSTEIKELKALLGGSQDAILLRCGHSLLKLDPRTGEISGEMIWPPDNLDWSSDSCSRIFFLHSDSILQFDPARNDFEGSFQAVKGRPLNLHGKVPTSFSFDGERYAAIVSEERTINLYSLRKKNPLWSFKAGARITTPPIFYQKKLLVMSEDNFIYCLKLKDGALIYKKKASNKLINAGERIENTVVFSPFASSDLNLLHIATGNIESIFSLESYRFHFIYQPSYENRHLAASYADFFSANHVLIVFETEIKEEQSF